MQEVPRRATTSSPIWNENLWMQEMRFRSKCCSLNKPSRWEHESNSLQTDSLPQSYSVDSPLGHERVGIEQHRGPPRLTLCSWSLLLATIKTSIWTCLTLLQPTVGNVNSRQQWSVWRPNRNDKRMNTVSLTLHNQASEHNQWFTSHCKEMLIVIVLSNHEMERCHLRAFPTQNFWAV